jgi:hypothetical protein
VGEAKDSEVFGSAHLSDTDADADDEDDDNYNDNDDDKSSDDDDDNCGNDVTTTNPICDHFSSKSFRPIQSSITKNAGEENPDLNGNNDDDDDNDDDDNSPTACGEKRIPTSMAMATATESPAARTPARRWMLQWRQLLRYYLPRSSSNSSKR